MIHAVDSGAAADDVPLPPLPERIQRPTSAPLAQARGLAGLSSVDRRPTIEIFNAMSDQQLMGPEPAGGPAEQVKE